MTAKQDAFEHASEIGDLFRVMRGDTSQSVVTHHHDAGRGIVAAALVFMAIQLAVGVLIACAYFTSEHSHEMALRSYQSALENKDDEIATVRLQLKLEKQNG